MFKRELSSNDKGIDRSLKEILVPVFTLAQGCWKGLRLVPCHTKLTRQISLTKTNTGMQERSFSVTPSLSIVIANYTVENIGGKVGWLPQGSNLSDLKKSDFFLYLRFTS